MMTPNRPANRKVLWLAAGLLVAAVAAPQAADARGFVSFGFGVPLAGPAYYPPPAYYYPPPAYYYPPPVYYAPPPAAYAPPPQTYGQNEQTQQTCREHQSTTTIDGRPQQTYGTACLQPDGTWQIVR